MLQIKFVLLWSDLLFFVLIAAVVVGGVWAGRVEHLRLAWRQVGQSRVGMATATVLIAFVLVALLDSLHYRERLPGDQENYAVEVRSALDATLTGLRTRAEKTYSAPLATHLFAKESLDTDLGRSFPRLKHGGAHLGDDLAAHDSDIAAKAVKGLGLGLLGTLVFGLVSLPLRRAAPHLAWNAQLLTVLVLCLLAGAVAVLAGDYHVLGTDKVGQDVLYLTLKSVRTAILIGTLTTLIMLPAAVFLGLLAGYAGGWIDDVIQYLYTTLNSIPGVLLIAASVLMMQVVIDTHPEWFATTAERADARFLALCAILGITSWTGLCRLLRGEVLKLRELEYVQAARALGVSSARILWRHVLPNVMHIVMIAIVMDFSGLVLAEAVLSYVGIGVDPNTISFGTMINTARMELARDPMVWWSLVAAFAFMFVLVLAANLFADVMRDAFDPRVVKL
ncbi:MAG: ABC transporter permease [Gammaproteobacteria bacterium]|nr:ABC transporter permease [Rhodocyclaceae bacterium]MBU3910010.1 ABC transporter permease [Gammaproteobacteria bacterium]MBU3990687.1 ABC transporter permease [Gammaproteobacteria bacterium]MBU4003983.1 ABC transporter permease [Gammaproteobacteria bacterium]MBU4020230.1 ABC transporter permease [Gammaproteobacteria bacterium]